MKPRGELVKRIIYAVFIVSIYTTTRTTAGTQFSSHVTVNTPSLSFAHGVGDPLNAYGRRTLQRQAQRTSFKRHRRPNMLLKSYSHLGDGYILSKPSIPFSNEDIRHDVTTKSSLWFQNDYMQDLDLPLLPPSPYKVDSDDPESLWPEGLFLPPLRPPRFESIDRRADTADQDTIDPYLLEGTEATAALGKAKVQGHLFFDDFPHIASLLANQDLRIKNKLKPHRIASIRHTWPFNRP